MAFLSQTEAPVTVPCAWLTAAVFVVMASQAFAQNLPGVATHSESFPGDGCLHAIGDIDDDGYADYHVDFDRAIPGTFLRETLSVIYSGATGGALRTYSNWQTSSPTIPLVVPFALGDIDSDGDEEFAEMTVVNIPNSNGPYWTTVVEIFDNVATPAILTLTWPGLSFEGNEISSVGDLNADGIVDFVVSGLAGSGPILIGPYEFYVELINGADGSHLSGGLNGPLNLSSSASLGDVDGDGIDDYILSSTSFSVFANQGGGARIYSGVDHSPIRSFLGSALQLFGKNLLAVEDIDGDSVKDFLVLSSAGFLVPSFNNNVSAYSSVTGALLWVVYPSGGFFGSMVSAGDVNGDGSDDVLLNGSVLSEGGYIYSSRDGSLVQTLEFGHESIAAGPGVSTNAQCAIGDTNGDGIAEIVTIEPMTTSINFTPTGPVFTGTTLITLKQSHGGESYGNPTAGSSLSLAWVPSPTEPRTGYIELTGALPNAALFVGVSAAPGNGATFGAGHPLWISPLPQDLFLTATAMADGIGEFRHPEILSRPPIAGISLYYQVAQTTSPDAISNGLQLLFGN
ncbi:MAG: VCBS repeat-containing protein [Planctomycetota bacterium]